MHVKAAHLIMIVNRFPAQAASADIAALRLTAFRVLLNSVTERPWDTAPLRAPSVQGIAKPGHTPLLH